MPENFYDILGVNRNATKDEIKKAYRSLQMKYHPDRNKGDEKAINMSQKINEAYETLSSESKKRMYDMNLSNPFMNINGEGMDFPVDDIFSMFFGGGMGGPFSGMPGMPGMPPGAKIHVFHGGRPNFNDVMDKPTPIFQTLVLKMEQVLDGAYLPLPIERWVLEDGKKTIEKETIYVEVPPGIDNNEMIILRGKGNIINENNKGDIKVNIIVENTTQFERLGLDLILNKEITLKDALCGFTFEINYLNGKSYTLNNKRGNIIPDGYKKIYPEMGLKRGEHKGNMVIIFHVDFPKTLTDEQIDKLINIL